LQPKSLQSILGTAYCSIGGYQRSRTGSPYSGSGLLARGARPCTSAPVLRICDYPHYCREGPPHDPSLAWTCSGCQDLLGLTQPQAYVTKSLLSFESLYAQVRKRKWTLNTTCHGRFSIRLLLHTLYQGLCPLGGVRWIYIPPNLESMLFSMPSSGSGNPGANPCRCPEAIPLG
jgi:hypothetical protein